MDRDFTFEKHINSLIRNQNKNQRRNQVKIKNYMHNITIFITKSPNKKRILLKTFVTSQFNYYPLFWMCHSRT